jgi:hypothetical protein
VQESEARFSRASCKVSARFFTIEVSLKSLRPNYENGHVGVSIIGDDEDALRFTMPVSGNKAMISWRTEAGWADRSFDLPEAFRPDAYHLLRVEFDDRFARIALDGIERWAGRMLVRPASLALETRNVAAAFAGFALTEGWQDLFTREDGDPAETGWELLTGAGRWLIHDQQLCYRVAEDQPARESRPGMIAKGQPLESYELVVNARLDVYTEGGCYGFYPALGAGEPGPLFAIGREGDGWSLTCYEPPETRSTLLPESFDPSTYQQFRFRKRRGELSVRWGTHLLFSIEATEEPARPGLYARAAGVKFDMARVTAIADNIRAASNISSRVKWET